MKKFLANLLAPRSYKDAETRVIYITKVIEALTNEAHELTAHMVTLRNNVKSS
jgi:hypothetical protein